MRLEFAALSYGRPGYGLPSVRLVNMFPEAAASPGTSARLPRPCLELAYSLGASGGRGLYRQEGAFGGDLFAVTGTTLHRGTTSVGAVALAAYTRFAASYTQLVVVSGGVAYCYEAGMLSVIDVDGQAVSDVVLAGDRFYYSIVDDDRIYFSDIDDASTVDPLNYVTADTLPDAIVGMVALRGQVIVFGRTSTEFRDQTGDQDVPLIRSQGAEYPRGCISIRSIVKADNRVFWVGDDLKIYTLGAPDRVSDHAIEQRLRECETPSDIEGFAITWDGHDLVLFNIPGQGTFALHVESGRWLEWTSHGRTTFRCGSAAMVGSVPYLADVDTGAIYTLADVQTDDGDPVEWIATAIAPPGIINRLELEAAVGVGLEDNADPLVEMRFSDDQGRTWTAWRPRSLGLIGEYRTRPRWRNLGSSRRERVIEFRTTSPVRAVYSAVKVNEP